MTDATECDCCGGMWGYITSAGEHSNVWDCVTELTKQRDAARRERDEARERIASALAVRLSPLCCDGENNGEVAAYEDGYREALSDVRAALSEAL